METNSLALLSNVSTLLNTQLNCSKHHQQLGFVRDEYERAYDSYSNHLAASITSVFLVGFISALFEIVAAVAVLLVYRTWNKPAGTESGAAKTSGVAA